MRAVIVTTFLVSALCGAAWLFHWARKDAQRVNEFSKMVSVRSITSQALSAHYEGHGTFPRSLSELPLQNLNWGDEGSSSRDLERWHYASDGQTFTMTWTNADREVFLGGRGKDTFVLRDDFVQGRKPR
jgi:hypothetical protein